MIAIVQLARTREGAEHFNTLVVIVVFRFSI